MLCAWAWAMIAFRSPPFDLLTYQIHMPLPSNAVPLGGGAVAPVVVVGVLAGSFRIRVVPLRFERTPWGPLRYRRPERAFAGTPTLGRVVLSVFGLTVRAVRVPFASRTGNITRLTRANLRPVMIRPPP